MHLIGILVWNDRGIMSSPVATGRGGLVGLAPQTQLQAHPD